MNLSQVSKIVEAVLYEGYILYPYRPSAVKNQQRWSFGGVYPRAYSQAQGGAEPYSLQTQCLLQGTPQTVLQMLVRFLHLIDREVGALPQPLQLRLGQGPGPLQQRTGMLVHRCHFPLLLFGQGQDAQCKQFVDLRAVEEAARALGGDPGIVVEDDGGGEQSIGLPWLADQYRPGADVIATGRRLA